MPEKFSFEISAIPGIPNLYELDDSGSVRHSDSSEVGEIVCTPTELKWDEFSACLTRIGVRDWKTHYDDPEILDGCFWELLYKDNQIHVETSGLNAYPESFQELEAAIAILLGTGRDNL